MEDFNHAVAETINNLSLAGVAHIYEPMIDEIEKIKGSYGRLLRGTYIGRDNTSVAFGNNTVEWREISQKWRARKKIQSGNRFYRGISPTNESLASALFSLPGEKLFGKTQMRTRLEQVQTDGFYNPRIRRRIETVYRNDRGQFARANAEARRTVRVTVNPFPGLDRDEESPIRQLPISDKNKLKLFANDESRPLIGPYTEWFFQNRLRTKIIQMARRARGET